jgi:pilus assembly protein Flp/PilA
VCRSETAESRNEIDVRDYECAARPSRVCTPHLAHMTACNTVQAELRLELVWRTRVTAGRVAHALHYQAPWSRSCRQNAAAAFVTGQRAQDSKARHTERDVMNLIARLRALLRDSSGQDLLEYALLVALIALVCVAVITSTGSGVQTIFSRISSALTNAVPAP